MLARDAQETGAIGLGGLFSPLAISLVTCHNPFIGFFLRVCKNYFKKFSVGPLKPIFIQRTGSEKLTDWARLSGIPVSTLGNFLNGEDRAGEKLLKKLGEFLTMDRDDIENPQPRAGTLSPIQDRPREFQSDRDRELDRGMVFLLDEMTKSQVRAQINRALDADEGKIAHDMIAFMELKWPPGGIKT